MKLSELTRFLESWAPLNTQESYDNSGLLTGSAGAEVSGALLTLDCTEAVLDEAIDSGVNLVICHHPPFFTAMKRFNGSDESQRILIKAIKNDISIYAAHTNLDHAAGGVSDYIADKLGLQHKRVLKPLAGKLKKLVCYCPPAQADAVRDALFSAGAGSIENYSECSFVSAGTQTFMPMPGAVPFSGKIGSRTTGEEVKIECVYGSWLEKPVLSAMVKAHPYEIVAHDICLLDNAIESMGAGIAGELEHALSADEFLALISHKLKASGIRYTAPLGLIKRVAVCGGSGSFLLKDAISHGCDALVTADFKYHQFFDADGKILIADIGHFESEQFTPELLYSRLSEKFPNFALLLSKVHTNPIFYYNGNNC